MRKIIYVLGAFVGMSGMLAAQEIPAIQLQVGDQLLYLVENGEKSYNFDITLTEVTDGIAFSFVMSGSASRVGSIKVTAPALKTATKYLNGFKSEDKILEDQSSVFMSDANYNDLVTQNKTILDNQDGKGPATWTSTLDELLVTYKKNTIYRPAYFLKMENSTNEMMVLKGGSHHIIAQLKMGFSLRLMGIQ